VAHAPRDGYTLLMATVSLAIAPSVYPKLSFRVPEDFAGVSTVASVPLILVVHPAVPVKSVQDLIRVAKERPGKLNYASVGAGSPQHFAAELFQLKTGTQFTHVPYKGGAPANTALLANEAQLYFSGMPPALPLVQAGRLRALAVTSARRAPAASEVPTMAEAGLPGSEADNWHAVLAPRAVPEVIVQKLHGAFAAILGDSSMQKQFLAQGAEARTSTPRALEQFMREEADKWRSVARAANIRLQ
jgi:tripartite-type tricarboxylate transporter receptor subunit TctC